MLKAFQKNIYKQQLFTKTDRLLVAVSGGVDSMVLCELLRQSGYGFAIAHANFQLRGADSDGDADFVRQFAEKKGCVYHEKGFDTEGVVRAEKVGIQEAARRLRYDWLENVRQTHDYDWILTAHHGSDSVETALFNFSRGAGLTGLLGIQPKNGVVVRPLLPFTKAEIEQFAKENSIDYRLDASNLTDKYSRNYIRHHIVPSFQTLNPSFESTALDNLSKLNEAAVLLDFFIEKAKAECVQTINNQCFIDKNKLKTYPSVSTLLFHFINEFGFNTDQIKQILTDDSAKAKVGTQFLSATHELRIERDVYEIRPITKPIEAVTQSHRLNLSINTEGSIFELNMDNSELELGKTFALINNRNLFLHKKYIELHTVLNKNKQTTYLNLNKIIFPLQLRHPRNGDRFAPLGMNGQTQLLSDFFRLRKLTRSQKEQVWLLENGDGQICWVIGHRISENFKITEGVSEALFLKI